MRNVIYDISKLVLIYKINIDLIIIKYIGVRVIEI